MCQTVCSHLVDQALCRPMGKRLHGKQTRPDDYPPAQPKSVKNGLGKVVSTAGRKKHTKLQHATKTGLVSTAQRPFAYFCKMKGLRVQEAKVLWDSMSALEKKEVAAKSRETFAEQRRQSLMAGVNVRARQLSIQTCDGSLEAASKAKRLNCFSNFMKEKGMNMENAANSWGQLPDDKKAEFRDLQLDKEHPEGKQAVEDCSLQISTVLVSIICLCTQCT